MKSNIRSTPFPIVKDLEKVKETLEKLKRKESIGFLTRNSLY